MKPIKPNYKKLIHKLWTGETITIWDINKKDEIMEKYLNRTIFNADFNQNEIQRKMRELTYIE